MASAVTPSIEESFRGFLLDMDGTLIDSTKAVEKTWRSVAQDIGIDPNVILRTSHGRRTTDVLSMVAPETAKPEYVRQVESSLLHDHGHEATEIPGARVLLDALARAAAPCALVTSASAFLVAGWTAILRLPLPALTVTADDVRQGKPDPTCFRIGLEKLQLQLFAAARHPPDALPARDLDRLLPADVLVLEDSPAGVRAGKTAGCRVLGLATSHSAAQVLAAGADWVVRDLDSVRLVASGGGAVRLEFTDVFTAARPPHSETR